MKGTDPRSAVSGLCAVVGLLALLAGCSPDRAEVLENGGAREAMAMKGVDTLREQFNRGGCELIFDQADVAFRYRQSKQTWLEKCKELRRRWGTWRSFAAHVERRTGVQLSVAIGGAAEFVNGRVPVETTWHFDHGRAELFSLNVNGEPIPAYRWPRPQKRYLDPLVQHGSEAA